MDIYGNPTGLEQGGKIEGDLEIDGNLDVDGDMDVSGTLTADTLIARETVETKDALIHLALDNVADTSNLGTFWEYTNAGKKYGGLARSAGQKKVYLFKDEPVKPTPSSLIINYPRDDLVLNELDCVRVNASSSVHVGEEDDSGQTTLGNQGFNFYHRTDNTDGGVGNSKFKARGVPALKTAILSGDVLSTNITHGYDGTSDIATGRDLYRANENFSAGNNGTRYELEITPDGTSTKKKYLELADSHLAIGDVAGGTDYKLPTTRGTVNQMLQTDASGVVSWTSPVNPFDQDLNTTDDVKFNSVDTPLINTAGNLIFKSGTGAFGMGDAGGSNAGLIIQTDNAGQPDFGFNVLH
jgi:hypothetical protein